MSLFVIGGVRCELHPFNVEGVGDESDIPFARHQILGGRTAHERVALHDRKLRLEGKIFPRRIGGETELALLEQLHAAGQAVMVTRGQSKMGWYVLTKIDRRHARLDERGVGRRIDVRIEMELARAPTAAEGAGILTRLFGYA